MGYMLFTVGGAAIAVSITVAIFLAVTIVLAILAVAVVITIFSLLQVYAVNDSTKIRQLLLKRQFIDQCIFRLMSVVSTAYVN